MSELRRTGEEIAFLLNAYGVDTVFGLAGVHSLELYRALDAAGIRHIGVRHEQGAGFMADGWARARRRPGVCLLISGPGVTNAATPIGQAYSDSVPMLVLTAALARGDTGLGRGKLHEITDQRLATQPLTGASTVAWTAEQVPVHLARAFARLAALRPRPVHLSVPQDVLAAPLMPSAAVPLPSPPGADPAAVAEAAALLAAAERPMIVAGGGAVAASDALRRLAEAIGAAVVTTVAGKGVVPDSHPLSLGASLNRPATRRALHDADVVLAIGTELSEGDLYLIDDGTEALPLPDASMVGLGQRLIRVDIDPETAVRDCRPALAITADARLAAEALAAALPAADGAAARGREQAAAVRAGWGDPGPLARLHDAVLAAVRAGLPDDALVYADMTQIAYTGNHSFPVERPGCWHFPMGFGTLGYALPAAIGGQLACPDRAVAVLIGDGGLQFTLAELATAVQHKLPLAILLWDNEALGEIVHWMQARQVPLVDVYPLNPDFAALARAYDLAWAAPDSPAALTQAVTEAQTRDRPTLIRVHQATMAAAVGIEV